MRLEGWHAMVFLALLLVVVGAVTIWGGPPLVPSAIGGSNQR